MTVSFSIRVENFGNIVLIAMYESSGLQFYLVVGSFSGCFCCCGSILRSNQSNNLIWACFHTNAATGTQLVIDVKADCLSILNEIDLVSCDRIESAQFQCVHRACYHTIVTTGTSLHV
jgi:hypothetical protein